MRAASQLTRNWRRRDAGHGHKCRRMILIITLKRAIRAVSPAGCQACLSASDDDIASGCFARQITMHTMSLYDESLDILRDGIISIYHRVARTSGY